jgi:hypothetical protein
VGSTQDSKAIIKEENTMQKLIQTLIVLILFALVITACQSSPPPPVTGDLLFQDDFSNPSSGWDQVNRDDGGQTNYGEGFYRIFVNTTGKFYWANPGLDLTDVQIEVAGSKAGGPDDNTFGVICRYQDNDNFYEFIISSDGYAGIAKIAAGKTELISGNKLYPTDAIQLGDATNHIRANCIGDTLTLIVNGVQVAQVKDTDFPSGDVGLFAGAATVAGVDIHFDNFSVSAP